MKITIEKGSLTDTKSDLVIVNLFEGVKIPGGATGAVDKFLKNLISDFVIKKEGFKGEFGSTYLLTLPDNKIFSKVLIVGLGKQKDFNIKKIRELSSKLIQRCKCMENVKTVTSVLHGAGIAGLNPMECAQAITEGTLIGAYSFDKYKSKKSKNKISDFKIIEINEKVCKEAEKGLKKAEITADAVNFARDLSNEPAAAATPSKLAELAKAIKGLEVTVYDKEEIEKLGMKAFLAVGQGSDQPPKFIHMKYSPKKPKKKVAIIGKGITFDSGGMDIKPASSMLNMKDDMSAAADIIAVMKAVAVLKPDVEVHGLVAACENMVNGNSYKPGDVLTAKNGKTIEVDNTDAEGRITLADVLVYAEELGVDEIVDMATLTGACLVALGSAAAGIFTNNDNFLKKITKHAEKAGENMWMLPIFDEYKESLKSDIADMKNTGSRYGGASVAAAFLQNFLTGKTPWVHIDIAGMAYVDKADKMGIKAATGFGVRTLIDYVTES